MSDLRAELLALADDWEQTAGPIAGQRTSLERLYQAHADDLRALVERHDGGDS